MKRLVLGVLLALNIALIAPVVAPPAAPVVGPAPAAAGYYYWDVSGCNPNVEWMITDQGIWYWLWGYSESHGAHLVANGYYRDTYAALGYECGFLGAPLTNRYYTSPTHSQQDFQGGRIQSNF